MRSLATCLTEGVGIAINQFETSSKNTKRYGSQSKRPQLELEHDDGPDYEGRKEKSKELQKK